MLRTLQPLRHSRGTLVSLGGLLVGILGLVVQWFADPAKFGGFPPGILFLIVFGLLTAVTAKWWWHPVFAVFIAFWIVGVGGLAGQLTPNLTSHNPGTVTGNVIMTLGLAVTFVAGILSMITARRTRRTAPTAPLRAHQR
ncbi:hypothetical protein K7472_02750 [Streptomyces sp. PTM05]|uniref:Integral membrane protein n=1 Tax=Streptantibioticus parmotrematis TaxID=2873249 RepID=A0ABS7QKQ1_9ACTN|nr:hypothetical protein [Streptantibioticus parmotrematis]MBY8883762.1 hypothetical protein [Streptantibioticus parmotrematis]